MNAFRPDRVLVFEESAGDSVTKEILGRLPGAAVQAFPTMESALGGLTAEADPLYRGKRTLILARHTGPFMNPCPGAGAEMCCGYTVANLASNCPLDCSYCVLQSLVDNPAVVLFTNVDHFIGELEDTVGSASARFYRIGTGDFSDSLALDHLTRYSRRLIKRFARLGNAVLELKTKTSLVENLAGLDHRGRTVVSWSMNTRRIIRNEERRTAPLEERIAAARRCQDWGYPVGFHFDPMVCYPGWEREYEDLTEEIFSSIEPAGVAWISLGSLRLTTGLRDIVRARFPESPITYGEFVPGHDGKWRYFRPIRSEMYAGMVSWIRRYAPKAFIYLCMENRAAWHGSLDRIPADGTALCSLMDNLMAKSL